MRKYIILLILPFFCISAFTQDYKGKVTSGKEGVANVIVSNGIDVAKTDQNGEYTLPYHAKAKFITITIPSAYEVPNKYSVYDAYRVIEDGAKSYDFSLKARKNPSDDFTLFVTAEPYMWSENNVNVYDKNVIQTIIDDKKKLSKNADVYGIVLGDIIGGNTEARFLDYKKMLARTYMPFFSVIGDHDHNREATDSESAKVLYEKNLGPRYYGFNLGKFYFIVLDDILWQGRQKYTGGIDDMQMNWLRQYLKYIPEGSNVVVCLHIPTMRRRSNPPNLTNTKDLHELLKPYNVHFFSAHMRYIENYRQGNRYEHIHAASSGVQNHFDMNKDGTPNGYAVYEFKGDNMSWYYKTFNRDKNFQFSVSNKGAHPNYPGKIIVNVWNWDDKWTVKWYEDGKLMAEPERVTDYALEYQYGVYKVQTDPNRMPVKVYHLFVIEPSASAKKIRVEVTDPFGNIYTKEISI